jgi:hypothetical protein
MSSALLQRVMTRMLFDPTFAHRVYTDPAEALRGHPISDTDLKHLTHPDPRRWRADTERPHRALEGLLTHLPATLALRATLGGEPAELLEFFKSQDFHTAIMSRTLLSSAFATWLTARPPLLNTPWGAPIATLEATCAELRATPLSGAERGGVPPEAAREATRTHTTHPTRLSRRARLLWLPEGTTQRFELIRAALSPLPPLAPLSPPPLPAEARALLSAPSAPEGQAPAREGALLERSGGVGEAPSVGVSVVPSALAALLDRAAAGAALRELISLVEGAGVSPEGALEVVAGLLEEGLVGVQEGAHR